MAKKNAPDNAATAAPEAAPDTGPGAPSEVGQAAAVESAPAVRPAEAQALERAIETAMDGVAERLEDAANARPPAAPVAVVAFLVRARREGFRRAGRAWSAIETRVEAAELTDDQVAALLGEPMLDVVGVAE